MKTSGKLALALFAAALLGAGPAVAQTETGAAQPSLLTQVTVTGAVSRIHGEEFELSSGQTVYVTDDTVIKPEGASLSVRPVTITGYVNEQDGSINATEIDVTGDRQ